MESHRSENDRLRRRVRKLQAEVANLRAGEGPVSPVVAGSPPSPGPAGGNATVEGDGGGAWSPRPPPSGDPQIAASLAGIADTLNGFGERLRGLEEKVAMPPPPTVPTSSRPRMPPTGVVARGNGGRKKKRKEREGMAVPRGSGDVPQPTPGSPAIAMGPPLEGSSTPAAVAPNEWTIVAGKKRKTGKKGAGPGPPAPPSRSGQASQRVAPMGAAPGRSAAREARKRLPRSAAVMLAGQDNLSGALTAARRKIKLSDLGIDKISARGAHGGGGLLLEIPGGGPEAEARADRLTTVLQMTLREDFEGIRVTRPAKRLDLRLKGVEESISEEEIRQAIAAKGGCSESEIRVGPLRPAVRRLRTVWVQCPARVAVRVAEAGRITVGAWFSVRAELLADRPARCFRCLARGHTQRRCPSREDRAASCFQCGEGGHRGANCVRPAHCPICATAGRKADHRAGSEKCTPIPPAPRAPPGRGNIAPPPGGGVTEPTGPGPASPGEVGTPERGSPEPGPSRAGTRRVLRSEGSDRAAGPSRTPAEKRPRGTGGEETSPPLQMPMKVRALSASRLPPGKPGPRSRKGTDSAE
ncbi:collagen alpha-1(I) chain-like [Linepithema humile]|uniref:collagen alpha-1(I) chain-like n=1 Tax=Linepithema humile TaxID=83485 RepID=UPI00351DBEF9